MDDIMVIGIAGGSGSGKTTITLELVKQLGPQVTVITHDNYYRAHHEMTYEERSPLNYDHPDAFDTDLLCEHIRELKAWHAVEMPVYDYSQHNRSDQVIVVHPAPVLILEGNVLEVTVKDWGCGIPDVKKAMEPLYTTAPEEERSGLGFSVMESFMDKLTVRSVTGKGTTVTMRKRLKVHGR